MMVQNTFCGTGGSISPLAVRISTTMLPLMEMVMKYRMGMIREMRART